jgi:hypothetical protein
LLNSGDPLRQGSAHPVCGAGCYWIQESTAAHTASGGPVIV